MVKHSYVQENPMRRILFLTTLASAVLLAGCPKRDAVLDAPPDAPPDAEGAAGAQSGGVDSSRVQEGELIGERDSAAQQLQGLLAENIVYFDYDQAEIRGEFSDMVAAHARNLGANPRLRVRLEGHSDERGSREYNIGLGERRAQAVRRALLLQGAGDDQITTVSYGEERPAVMGSDENAWSRNRRVEIVYAN
jgi:peptidoglycan-associated lipoprotein